MVHVNNAGEGWIEIIQAVVDYLDSGDSLPNGLHIEEGENGITVTCQFTKSKGAEERKVRGVLEVSQKSVDDRRITGTREQFRERLQELKGGEE